METNSLVKPARKRAKAAKATKPAQFTLAQTEKLHAETLASIRAHDAAHAAVAMWFSDSTTNLAELLTAAELLRDRISDRESGYWGAAAPRFLDDLIDSLENAQKALAWCVPARGVLRNNPARALRAIPGTMPNET